MKKIKKFVLLITAVCLLAGGLMGTYPALMENSALAAAYSQVGSYTVKFGDTLFLIARKYGISVSDLKSANNLKSDLIMPGKVLSIPAKESGPVVYTVKSGDSLYTISKQFGVATDRLKSVNNLGSDAISPYQVLLIPPVQEKPLAQVMAAKGITASNANLSILVDKSDHVLSLYSGSTWLKAYHVELGEGGPGDKEVSGDHKTPEGTFQVCQISVLSPVDEFLGSRWMRLSYPNVEDAQRGLQKGIITQSQYQAIVNASARGEIPLQETGLGGGVGIHGGSTPQLGKDWTWGCVGLSNKDVEEFYGYVKVGTKVTIQK